MRHVLRLQAKMLRNQLVKVNKRYMHRCNPSCVCHKCSCKYEYHNNEDVNKHKCKPFNAASAIAAGIMYIVISDQESSLVGLPVIMVGI